MPGWFGSAKRIEALEGDVAALRGELAAAEADRVAQAGWGERLRRLEEDAARAVDGRLALEAAAAARGADAARLQAALDAMSAELAALAGRHADLAVSVDRLGARDGLPERIAGEIEATRISLLRLERELRAAAARSDTSTQALLERIELLPVRRPAAS